MAELAMLNPPPLAVDVGGRSITAPVVRIGGLAAMQAACAPIMAWLSSFNFAGAMVNARADAVRFLVESAGVDDPFVESLTIAESVKLANAVMEANSDFFVQLLAEISPVPAEKDGSGVDGSMPLPD